MTAALLSGRFFRINISHKLFSISNLVLSISWHFITYKSNYHLQRYVAPMCIVTKALSWYANKETWFGLGALLFIEEAFSENISFFIMCLIYPNSYPTFHLINNVITQNVPFKHISFFSSAPRCLPTKFQLMHPYICTALFLLHFI